MRRVCEICGQLEAQEEEKTEELDESFHLYLCEQCIDDLRWQG